MSDLACAEHDLEVRERLLQAKATNLQTLIERAANRLGLVTSALDDEQPDVEDNFSLDI